MDGGPDEKSAAGSSQGLTARRGVRTLGERPRNRGRGPATDPADPRASARSGRCAGRASRVARACGVGGRPGSGGAVVSTAQGTLPTEEWKERARKRVPDSTAICRHRTAHRHRVVHGARDDGGRAIQKRRRSDESLILAQDQRWRRALRMQVARARRPLRRRPGQWRTGEEHVPDLSRSGGYPSERGVNTAYAPRGAPRGVKPVRRWGRGVRRISWLVG